MKARQLESMVSGAMMKICDNCRRRKVKCDRAQPCSRCRDSGLSCVSTKSTNLPRGRKGGRRKINTELNARVAKLEDLINQVAEMASVSVSAESHNRKDTSAISQKALPDADHGSKMSQSTTATDSQYFATSMFANICQNVHDLAEFLHQSSVEEDDNSNDLDEPPADSKSIGGTSHPRSHFPFSAQPVSRYNGILHGLTDAHTDFLFEKFMENVDPLLKLLHPVVLQRIIRPKKGDGLSATETISLHVLKCAIFYITVTSLSDRQCSQYLDQKRATLLPRLQTTTEIAMIDADILTSENMYVLQPLVFYLYAVRCNDASKRAWTLTSLAVRLGQALGLHREVVEDTVSPYSVFDTELRRRLWWQVCLLERHSSFDRASDPMITYGSFNTHQPCNINDADLEPGTDCALRDRDEYTDMTFSLVCHEIFNADRQLNFVSPRTTNEMSDSSSDWWSARRDLAIEYENRLRNTRIKHCDHNIPLQRYTAKIGEIMIAHLWLIVYRPLQRHPSHSKSPELPPYGILSLAIQVIECSRELVTDPDIQVFRWMSSIWVQWHALAVMIADLHVHVDGVMVERAWALLDEVFDEMGERTADSRQGRIWRFIEKMLIKARDIRRRHLERTGTLNAGVPEVNVRSDADATFQDPGFAHNPPETLAQMRPALQFSNDRSGNPLEGLAGAFAGQGFEGWSDPLLDEPQIVDRGWLAEWDAFVEEYQRMTHDRSQN